ncbi:MAG TPA: organomercurial lyase [Candidatus Dormibacteraeota bacterium]|nr:organomercurial lyase [Candidatus Dormibacteraeota bacterium]
MSETTSEPLGGEVGRAAFRRLLRTGRRAEVRDLASDLGRPVEEVEARVAALDAEGRMRLDDAGGVVGAAGLSVVPDRHRLDLDRRTLWTWCAFDLIGIAGALRADGVGRSVSPWSGLPLEVRFRGGQPEPGPLALFRPDDAERAGCRNLYREWCSNTNLFESPEAARAWSEQRRLRGRVLGLGEAADLARGRWEPLTEGLRWQR